MVLNNDLLQDTTWKIKALHYYHKENISLIQILEDDTLVQKNPELEVDIMDKESILDGLISDLIKFLIRDDNLVWRLSNTDLLRIHDMFIPWLSNNTLWYLS